VRWLLTSALVGLTLAAGGRADAAGASRWLHWDATTHTVRLTLAAGYNGSNNGFNFDGYGRGRLLVRVPVGWRVVVTCVDDSPRRSSCAVVRGAMTTDLAFRGAASPDPVRGLGHGESASFTFTASRRGTFRLASLVPGQEAARMWDVVDVVRGERPSLSVRAGF
jgi:hypothetical protein